MDPKDIERILKTAENQPGSPLAGIAGVYKQMQTFSVYLHHLETGLVHMAQDLQALGFGAQMVLKILVDKEILTEEELEKLYVAQVLNPMEKAVKEMEAKAQEANEKIQEIQEATEKIIEEEEEEQEESPVKSDVVLASERGNNVIKFPDGK
jgi:hypothetical protein